MIVVLASLVGAFAFAMLWRELWAKNRPRKLSKVAGTATIVLIAVLVLLTATGRLHWLAALIAGALPFLRWVLGMIAAPLIGHLFRSKVFGQAQAPPDAGAAGSGSSTVATDELKMTLDHASGELDGEVLGGRLAGQRLSNLDLTTLKTLYGELAATDSRQLLAAYLDRRFPDWSDATTERTPPAHEQGMDREQALAVLGLQGDASEEEIVGAHRRLIQKLHPDRGGTDYLAATLNLAKRVLLGKG